MFSKIRLKEMRTLLIKRNSTHSERIFAEQLKNLHIPFKHRVKIKNKEIDFIVGDYAIEIDGHKQSSEKNNELIMSGYIPIHFNNNEINSIKLCQEQICSHLKRLKQSK